MNESELDTDEEDLMIEEATIDNLKNNFTYDDFWDYLNQMYDKFCRKSMIFCTQTILFFSTIKL